MRFMFKKWYQKKEMLNLLDTKLSNTQIIKKKKERKNMESIEIKEELIPHQVLNLMMMTIQ